MESIIRPDGGASKLTVEALTACYRALKQQAPQPVAWTIQIPAGTYKMLWNIQKPMRKKIARMARRLRKV
jgi:hypothetical protein